MKKLFNLNPHCFVKGIGVFMIGIILFTFSSCQKNNQALINSSSTTAPRASTQDLINYKNSSHTMSAGYYAITGEQFMSVPDSVDIIDLWGIGIEQDNGASLPYIKKVQEEKGTTVIQCYWPPNEVADQNQAGYEKWAKDTYERLIVKEGLDGLDLDMEIQLISNMSTSNRELFMTEICKYFGKSAQHTVPRTGKKPLLVFGTDASIGTTLLDKFKDNIDYVFFQSYACPPNRWYGNLEDLSNEMAEYNAGDNKKFFAMASAEGGYAWNLNSYIGGTEAQILEYAKWSKRVGAGGCGVYHQEFDASNTPSYYYTKRSIELMNGM